MKLLWLTFYVALVLAFSSASAKCSFDTVMFEGKLKVAAKEDGFATILATPEDDFSQVLFDCEEGTTATLTVTPPRRLKDGGPKLDGPFTSYIIYNGRIYTQKDTIPISEGFENRVIQIGMSIENKGKILLAGKYKYQSTVVVLPKADPGGNQAK